MTKLRIVKGYRMLEVAVAPGEVVEVEATFKAWNPDDPDNRWLKKRAIGRGVWHVQWNTPRGDFGTSFVDGLDAYEVKSLCRTCGQSYSGSIVEHAETDSHSQIVKNVRGW